MKYKTCLFEIPIDVPSEEVGQRVDYLICDVLKLVCDVHGEYRKNKIRDMFGKPLKEDNPFTEIVNRVLDDWDDKINEPKNESK